ncbi:inter-alpha-trypsin inhibitor heavy chain H4-like isoform X1 [Aethina tumida]|uniref:inter-alpha-trypsin inhibitor heavy chain H4-like isoform X1 n=1 Tax=Aethina tumida TaxID=116153 RepID=UPI0021494CA4|nr:inter-alpha-trypsin inhibitor heavy chain H4-like isoform X1 [Aethina tumida]
MILKIFICTLLCIILLKDARCGTEELIVTTEATNKVADTNRSITPKIYEMNIETNVTNRFATTLITSKVKNFDQSPQETTFSVVLPESAFISEFIMEMGGKKYKAYVKEKEEAKRIYDKAVSRGQGAAHVRVRARDSNRFTVNVNVEPESKAIFYLTYEELLQRQLEQYEVVLNIQPGQPVKDLDVKVYIDETRPLKFVRTPALRTGNEIDKNKKDSLETNADIKLIGNNSALVHFSPDIVRQKEYAKELGTNENNGLAGQFVVQYDVERDPQGGEILVNEGYFVHFFAPSDLPPLPKYVLFVLDTSGSMFGTRIRQLKDAMNSILSDLKPEDKFNIIEFATDVQAWDVKNISVSYRESRTWSYSKMQNLPEVKKDLPDAYQAEEGNIQNAMKVVNQFQAMGATNINNALKVSLQLIDKNFNEKNQPMIIFLTDGEATIGETSNKKIISTITELNTRKVPIFTLSFGDESDRKFLEKISLKNKGFARHIYEDADASLQLENFYKSISSPLLTNIKFTYVSNTTDLTETQFPILFGGSEIVVTGRIIDPSFVHVDHQVVGFRAGQQIIMKPLIERPVSQLERLWAYLTLKQLLKHRKAAKNKKGPTQEALRIALKYSFVSDVTSLVVVKPNDTSAVDTEDASRKLPRHFPVQTGIQHRPTNPPSGPSFGGRNYISRSPITYPPLYFIRSYDDIVSPEHLVTPIYLIKSQLPWLNSILFPNGTLTTPTGLLNLGKNGNPAITSFPCPLTPKNSNGMCKSLFNCPEVYSQLVDLQTFLKFTCSFREYTGICCPS